MDEPIVVPSSALTGRPFWRRIPKLHAGRVAAPADDSAARSHPRHAGRPPGRLALAGVALLALAAMSLGGPGVDSALAQSARAFVLESSRVDATFSEASIKGANGGNDVHPSGPIIIKDPWKRVACTVTLRRPFDPTDPSSEDLLRWREFVIFGQIQAARVRATLTEEDEDGHVFRQYELTEAWPRQYQLISAPAGDEVTTEKLVVQSEKCVRLK